MSHSKAAVSPLVEAGLRNVVRACAFGRGVTRRVVGTRDGVVRS